MKIQNGDLPAMPIEFSGFGQFAPEGHSGLTKREMFAAMAMQGLFAKNDVYTTNVAHIAVDIADRLLAALENSK